PGSGLGKRARRRAVLSTARAADIHERVRGALEGAFLMSEYVRGIRVWVLLVASAGCTALCAAESTTGAPIEIPTGQQITPGAAQGSFFQELDPKLPGAPNLRANHAAAVAVSPDGKALAILTSGSSPSYARDLKRIPELSMEYVFLFDISGAQPVQT